MWFWTVHSFLQFFFLSQDKALFSSFNTTKPICMWFLMSLIIITHKLTCYFTFSTCQCTHYTIRWHDGKEKETKMHKSYIHCINDPCMWYLALIGIKSHIWVLKTSIQGTALHLFLSHKVTISNIYTSSMLSNTYTMNKTWFNSTIWCKMIYAYILGYPQGQPVASHPPKISFSHWLWLSNTTKPT